MRATTAGHDEAGRDDLLLREATLELHELVAAAPAEADSHDDELDRLRKRDPVGELHQGGRVDHDDVRLAAQSLEHRADPARLEEVERPVRPGEQQPQLTAVCRRGYENVPRLGPPEQDVGEPAGFGRNAEDTADH